MHFSVGTGWVHAVDGVSFDLRRAETLGVVGESGSGKTSLGYTLLRLLPPNGRITSGEIAFDGVDLTALTDVQLRDYRWKRLSMIFQNAMSAMNPVLRVGDQIVDAICYHSKVGRPAAREMAAQLFEQVGISRTRLGGYPHEFSGGMKQRAIIALSLACGPELVIADEPTTALDVVAQEQVLFQMKTLQRDMQLAVIFISHDLSVIAQTCGTVAVMYAGEFIEYGPTEKLLVEPRHPYTMALLRSFPSVRGELRQLLTVPGSPPDLLKPPSGCRFNPRCPFVQDICRAESPAPLPAHKEEWVRCHFGGEIHTRDLERVASATRS